MVHPGLGLSALVAGRSSLYPSYMRRLLAGLLAFLLAAQPAMGAGQKQAPVPSLPSAVIVPAVQVPVFPAGTANPTQGSKLETLAVPPSATATHDSAKAGQNTNWEAAGQGASAADAPVAKAEEVRRPQLSAPDQARLDAAVADFGPIPAPPVVRGKAVGMLPWAATAVAGLAPHLLSDRIAPMIMALVFAPLMSLMWGVFAGSMSSAVEKVPAGRPEAEADQARWDYWHEKAKLAASSAKLPSPKTLTVKDVDVVQAQAGGSPNDYQFVVYKGLDAFPEKQQEAVMHHEAGHVKHHDSLWTMIQMFAVTLGPTLAMMAGAAFGAAAGVNGPVQGAISLGQAVSAAAAEVPRASDPAQYLSLLMIPMILASIPLWYKNKKRDEYHADQHAAHVMGSPEHMVRFFVENSETDAEREAVLRAAEGKPALKEKPVGWIAKALAAWRALRLMVSSHPTHEQRVRRLRALSVPADPGPR
jgi:Zn-dependent protease with chaperone function